MLRKARRSGEIVRVSRGVYVPRSPTPADGSAASRDRDIALAKVVGIHDRLRAQHWFARETAALVWGLPLWTVPTTTHVLQPRRAGARHDPDVSHHLGVPAPDEGAVVLGLPVTSLELTVVDCASSLPPLDALVVADAGLRAGADRDRIARLLDARAGGRGIVRARAVLELADDGAESPGESAARFVVLRDGLAVPTTQIRIDTTAGTFWADLGWPEWRIVLEYDGRDKYRTDARGVFLREKHRHDAIQESGWRVVRVMSEDLRGTALTRRVLAIAPDGARTTLRPRRHLRT